MKQQTEQKTKQVMVVLNSKRRGIDPKTVIAAVYLPISTKHI